MTNPVTTDQDDPTRPGFTLVDADSIRPKAESTLLDPTHAVLDAREQAHQARIQQGLTDGNPYMQSGGVFDNKADSAQRLEALEQSARAPVSAYQREQSALRADLRGLASSVIAVRDRVRDVETHTRALGNVCNDTTPRLARAEDNVAALDKWRGSFERVSEAQTEHIVKLKGQLIEVLEVLHGAIQRIKVLEGVTAAATFSATPTASELELERHRNYWLTYNAAYTAAYREARDQYSETPYRMNRAHELATLAASTAHGALT